jgi:shikimate kinase
MGAGKTTAGALLAERLGWRFVDSDRAVEESAGATVGEIFARWGEAAFRRMEAAAIGEAVRGERVVLALGGGALERPATRDLLASLAQWRTVFLEAPFDILLSRCAGQAHAVERPVLRDRERLAERWQARLPWYAEAHVTIATAHSTPEEVVERILSALGAPGGEGEARRPAAELTPAGRGGRA